MLGFHPFASVPAQCSVKVDSLMALTSLTKRRLYEISESMLGRHKSRALAEMAENKAVAAAARALEQAEQAEAAATTAGRQAWAFGFASYAVTGFYGLALMRGEPQSNAVIPKAGAVLLMAPLALNLGASVVGEDSSRYARRICAGLIFSAGGDACLALEDGDAYKDVKQLLFLGGLGCFLVGHLLYMSAFAANRFKVRKAVAAAIFVYVLSIFIVLYPSLPTALIAPVLLCKAPELARA